MVIGVFFRLVGVGGEGRRHAVNDGGGDVQQTTPGTSGSVGELEGTAGGDCRRRRRWQPGGGIVIILWLAT